MRNDDETVGRLLSRREMLELLGTAGAAWFTGSMLIPLRASADTPSCVVRPEQTEGPYFIEDEQLNRSDIRRDPTNNQVKEGMPLELTLVVSQIRNGDCQPLPDARVDLWHCDALGVYSDVRDPRFNTVGQKFLRGYQTTNQDGEARFLTIYPGWYRGRTIHIHFKIRTAETSGRGYEFTSQLYFNDALTDVVHASAPYAENGQRNTRNRNDGIFRNGGEQLMLDPDETAEGYRASFAIGMQIS